MINAKRYPSGLIIIWIVLTLSGLISIGCQTADSSAFQRLKYNNPGLKVDLGVGLWAWPLPMDYDGDGDNDLLVSCTDVPYNGIYFFENKDGDNKMPVLEPAVRIGDGVKNIQPSYVDGQIRLLAPAVEFQDFLEKGFNNKIDIYSTNKIHDKKIRANQWKYCDYDDDGDLDIIVGVGDWSDYGWDNAFNDRGQWMRGPLHGYIYLIRNQGSSENPEYSEPEMITAGDKPIDVYGMPSPNFADFDGDGDLDLICGEFLDRFTYFENIGRRDKPEYAQGRFLKYENEPIRMDLQMIVPVAFDWDKDGDIDLIVGQEDGRVAFVENTGRLIDGIPQFLLPVFFQEYAKDVKFGALVTPYSYDWDGDGDEDLICGNTAGYIGFIENLNDGNPPKWAASRYLKTGNQAIHIQAGPNGSIQGPCEAKWGYTTLNVADWDHDGLADIIINSIWGKVLWYKNIGTRQNPKLSPGMPITVEWQGIIPKPEWNWWDPEDNQLATQWRTTPAVVDWNGDMLNDLVMLDHQGYLAFYERIKKNHELSLLPGKRIFSAKDRSIFDNGQNTKNDKSGILQLNNGVAGKSGRRKICFVDWDLDGNIDLLVNSRNINFLRGLGKENDTYIFQDMGEVDSKKLAGHTTSPTIVDWDKNGIPDLLVGAEDGYFYFMKNPNDSTKNIK